MGSSNSKRHVAALEGPRFSVGGAVLGAIALLNVISATATLWPL